MNWYKYRLPGEAEIKSGCSERLTDGLHEGFAIAPFKTEKGNIRTIPADYPLEGDIMAETCTLPESTTEQQYFAEINAIKEMLDGTGDKIVAARVKTINMPIDLEETFCNLCKAYPDAFVFAFSTPETGTWIGASPELLLSKKKDSVATMALAGTRSSESKEEWDEKNIREQATVAKYVYDTLRRSTLYIIKDKTYTKKCGPVEHICTPMRGIIETRACLEETLAELAPTPAVCGRDKSKALSLIEKSEGFNREMYGGFCGPVSKESDLDLYVNLRCCKCTPLGITLYAGGGITSESDEKTEWQETEMKLSTMESQLRYNN